MVLDVFAGDMTTCNGPGRAMVPCLGEWFQGGSILVGPNLDFLGFGVSRCFYALARGGCQHTCSDMVYYAIFYVVC